MKRGTQRIAGICTVIVCEANGHAKHANTRGSGGMPPKEILNAPVDASVQNVLKCCYSYYLDAYIQAVIQLLFI